MILSDEILNHFKKEEGWKNKAYKDSLGKPTIGCGHLLSNKPSDWNKFKDLYWTDEQIIEQLQKDFNTALRAAKELYPAFNTYGSLVQLALVDMCFQMGKHGVSKFTTTNRLIKERKWNEAADQALKSLWARQTPNRAKRTTDKIRTGVTHDMVDWR